MVESELLPEKRCNEILLAVQAAAYRHGISDVEVHLSATNESLTRFANNEIGQNISERGVHLSVRTAAEGRTARASTNRLHRDGITAVVDEAVALMRACVPIPDFPPMYDGNEEIEAVERYSRVTASFTPKDRAEGVAEAIAVVEAQGQIAAGIYSTTENAHVLLNSRGVSRRYVDTLAQFSITAMTDSSSGWAKASSPVHEDVQPRALAEAAVRKAALSRNPVALAPAHYTVVLEPAAVLDLVGQIFGDFSGTALLDKRSFLNDRIGEALFGANITIYDDVRFPLQNGAAFDGEGVPRQTLTLVKNGVIRDIAYSRLSAARTAGASPTGHGFGLPSDEGEAPVNIVIAGGRASLGDLIRSTSDGILVTRLWYIREVEPYEKVMTGMTRDGTFRIRDGEVAEGIRNFRFNQSVVQLLRNTEALSASVRATGEEAFDMVVPGMKVHDFEFTEMTRF